MRPARHAPSKTHPITATVTTSTSFRDIAMNTQKTIASAATPARFDLRSTGLTDAQLKAIAGARSGYSTVSATVAGVTRCCWG